MYKLAELLPPTREGALRLGLVTLEQMVTALLVAVENPAHGIRVVSVPESRSAKAWKALPGAEFGAIQHGRYPCRPK
jgi:hypothetical protein